MRKYLFVISIPYLLLLCGFTYPPSFVHPDESRTECQWVGVWYVSGQISGNWHLTDVSAISVRNGRGYGQVDTFFVHGLMITGNTASNSPCGNKLLCSYSMEIFNSGRHMLIERIPGPGAKQYLLATKIGGYTCE